MPGITIDDNKEEDPVDDLLARGLLCRQYVDNTYKVMMSPEIFCG